MHYQGGKARDYLVKFPQRLNRIIEHRKVTYGDFKFSWIKG
ncbi:hypothetical protein SAMN05443550_1115 [Pedobacter hartonius]|uniref:Uncharacterized protein n=1 Tax=Pedobacter hartonius TaxID=425514 RepID=A0A1H4GRJ0_9SPHI|nr:hypothetical protein SAMN05443550_1115 [Pedobacter hartonius]